MDLLNINIYKRELNVLGELLGLGLAFHSARQFRPSCVVAMFFSILTFDLFLEFMTDPKGPVKIIFADELFSRLVPVVGILQLIE